jgi:ketosteroid isomerase-like protein
MTDLEALENLNHEYIRSVRASDVRWFEEHLSADFLNSNPDGSLLDRAAFLARIAQPIAVSGFDVEDVRVRLFGDTAIIHGRTVYRKPDGQPGAGRYTDVWLLRDVGWICVAAHVTRN